MKGPICISSMFHERDILRKCPVPIASSICFAPDLPPKEEVDQQVSQRRQHGVGQTHWRLGPPGLPSASLPLLWPERGRERIALTQMAQLLRDP